MTVLAAIVIAVILAPKDAASLFDTAAPGVVRIDVAGMHGTGFLIKNGEYIITASHLINAKKKILVTSYNGEKQEATLIRSNKKIDTAVLKVKWKNQMKNNLQFSIRQVKVGSKVYVIGHPAGYNWSLTSGLISGINRKIPLVSCLTIQTNCSINLGDSGSPLLDNQGNVIGMVIAIRDHANGIAFAVPASLLIGETDAH